MAEEQKPEDVLQSKADFTSRRAEDNRKALLALISAMHAEE